MRPGSSHLTAAAILALVGVIGACAPSNRMTSKAPKRETPSRNIELPYHFEIDGFQIRVSSADLSTSVTAHDRTIEDPIEEDERWLAIAVEVTEKLGRERQFPWVTMVRIRTALGAIENARHGISSRQALTASQETLAPGEHQEIGYFFRVKRGDFPIRVEFADGAAAPMGE